MTAPDELRAAAVLLRVPLALPFELALADWLLSAANRWAEIERRWEAHHALEVARALNGAEAAHRA